MTLRYLLTTILVTILLTFTGCQSDEDSSGNNLQINGEGIAIENAWARPGSEGRMSAGYFTIVNYETEADTLIGVSSDLAQFTEIHESYEQEGGMMGMREVSELVIPSQSTVNFEPGGLHVMFIQITQPFIADESLLLTLHFSNSGQRVIPLTVRP